MSTHKRDVTFEFLDKKAGITWMPLEADQEMPLPQWYLAVKDIPIPELSVRDLAIACRQQVHPDAVVPFALEEIRRNPRAGYMYDGELLVALKSIDEKFWSEHPELRGRVLKILADCSSELGDEVRDDATSLAKSIERAVGKP